MKDFFNNKWVKFGFWAALYLLWVIWLGNYWWLLGLIIIFDLYITKKVKWAFWRKKYKEGEKKNVWLEWLDAIIYAVIVVTFLNIFFVQSYMIPSSSMERTMMTGDYLFVSKVAYGPKIVETPLSVPFTHNTMPFTGKKSYVEWIKNPYRRLKGFSHVKREDIVVFGFPHGDSVLTQAPAIDYYTQVRLRGKDYTEKMYGPVIVRPDDKKDNYVKRCVAVAGETLELKDGVIFVDGIREKDYEGLQYHYSVVTNGTQINSKSLEKFGINPEEYYYDINLPGYPAMPLTKGALSEIEKLPNIISITKQIDTYPPDYPDSYLSIFPFDQRYNWTKDNLGPLWIPSKGSKVELTSENLPLYRRIISVYEKNDLQVKDGKFFINGVETNSYEFKQDYYFMMGDNRHNSLDSRYWGFVPESHVVGKPWFIWFSSDRNKSFPQNIRWNRLIKFV